jgi:hypothetical protein
MDHRGCGEEVGELLCYKSGNSVEGCGHDGLQSVPPSSMPQMVGCQVLFQSWPIVYVDKSCRKGQRNARLEMRKPSFKRSVGSGCAWSDRPKRVSEGDLVPQVELCAVACMASRMTGLTNISFIVGQKISDPYNHMVRNIKTVRSTAALRGRLALWKIVDDRTIRGEKKFFVMNDPKQT